MSHDPLRDAFARAAEDFADEEHRAPEELGELGRREARVADDRPARSAIESANAALVAETTVFKSGSRSRAVARSSRAPKASNVRTPPYAKSLSVFLCRKLK